MDLELNWLDRYGQLNCPGGALREYIMDIRTAFMRKYGREPGLIARAPGSVNLLGEYVEYNNGPVLPVTLDKVVTIAAAPRDDDVINLYAIDLDKQVTFSVRDLEGKNTLDGLPLPDWALFPAGVAWAIHDSGFEVHGLEAVYTSNNLAGIGLGLPAALEVGFAILWQSIGGWSLERVKLTQLCQRAENEYLGLDNGLKEQFASMHGVKGHALYFDNLTMEWEALPLLPNKSILLADSGVRRDPADSGYRERRESCEQAVELLVNYLPDIRTLRDVSPTEMAAYGYYLPPEVKQRAEHVVREIARVQSAVSALIRADEQAFGALMYSSHKSLRDLYEVSTPELDLLVDIARGQPGCVGAHLTSSGFGEYTVNLVEETMVKAFVAGLKSQYLGQTGLDVEVYTCQSGEGARLEDL